MKSIIVVILLMTIIEGMSQDSFGELFLTYKNYNSEKLLFSKMLDETSDFLLLTDSIYCSVENLLNVEMYPKISGALFDELTRYYIINQWSDCDKSPDAIFDERGNKDSIKKQNPEISLYNLGKRAIGENFDSHFILVVESDRETCDFEFNDFISRSLYIVNVSESKLKSIVRVSLFFNLEGHSDHEYTKPIKNNLFLLQRRIISTDIIVGERGKKKRERRAKPIVETKFYFDEEGFVRFYK